MRHRNRTGTWDDGRVAGIFALLAASIGCGGAINQDGKNHHPSGGQEPGGSATGGGSVEAGRPSPGEGAAGFGGTSGSGGRIADGAGPASLGGTGGQAAGGAGGAPPSLGGAPPSLGGAPPSGGGTPPSGGTSQGDTTEAGQGGASVVQAGSSPGGQGGDPSDECMVDADCVLFADCCHSCDAYPAARVPEPCPDDCIQTCPDDAVARCQEGRCVGDIPCSPFSSCGNDHYCRYADGRCGRGELVGRCWRRFGACDDDGSPACACNLDLPVRSACSAIASGVDVDAYYVPRGDSCHPAIDPDPRMEGIWLHDWTGDNLSYFTIALCGEGRARYVFFEGPQGLSQLEVEGRSAATSATEVEALFFTPGPFPSLPQVTLTYDPARDTVSRDTFDGYETDGRSVSPEMSLYPITACD
ncbi:MAG: hypothetical protein JW751_25075 [Polyangiaceae bacterium]|nr:hypothetical protein [Polyangiaceae bacterium]